MPTLTNNNRILRKLVVGFGNIFDDIILIRYNADGSENQRIAVPLIFAAKEKYVSRLIGDPDLDKKIQIVLPRMSFDLLGMAYAADRKQQTNIKNQGPQQPSGAVNSQYMGVPYDFDFELYLYVRTIEDGTQIIETILPFFTPEYTIKLNLVPTMGITKEIPVVLKNVKYDNEFEGERDSPVRIVIWTLTFTVKGFVYGPVSQSSIIKQAITNITVPVSNPAGAQFNMANTGFGYYKTGELVYQGYNLEMASATGTVVSYSNTTNILLLSDITGTFKTNTSINGTLSQSEFILNNLVNNIGPTVIVTSSVNPPTANITDNYTITTTIEEI